VSSRRLERLGALCGILYVILLFVGEVALGDTTHPPSASSGERVVAFFEQYGSGSLIGAYIQAFAAMVLLCFVASVVTTLASQRQHVMALVAAFGGVVVVGVFLVYLLLTASLAFGAASDGGLDPGAASAVYQARFMAETFYSFPVAVLVTAVSVGTLRTKAFPRWYVWFGVAVGIAFLVGGADVAQEGFFAPDGGYGFILFWLFPLWLIVTSVLFMRRAGRLRVGEPSPGGA
jgi:hypothetical protein